MAKRASESRPVAQPDELEYSEGPVQVFDVPTHAEDPILSLSEIGQRLNRHRSTISRWCTDGLLTALRRPDDRILGVRRSELNKFLGGSALRTQVQ